MGKEKQKYLASGVKRLFILSITGHIPESYNNVARELSALGIDEISSEFTVAADMGRHLFF